MAKFGEGDKRWIVEDRPDGTNVHNWHWSETDCLDWSRNFLSNLLCDKIILSGEDNLHVKTKQFEKFGGEAYVNVRKGKKIPGYELNLVLNYEAEARDSDGSSVSTTAGSVELPYISVENADEDPEIRVTIKDNGPIGKRLKEAVIGFVFEKIRAYVDAMAQGGPVKNCLLLRFKKPVPASVSFSNNVANDVKRERKKEGFKTITMSEKFRCRARYLFEILMDENRWKGFTQSKARISKEVGGEFSVFDGSVTGKNLELQEGKLIVQQWRFRSWPDGVVSKVCLTFEEPESGVTVVKLTHANVPEEDRYGNATVVENTERGWRDLIFNRIRAVFGFRV